MPSLCMPGRDFMQTLSRGVYPMQRRATHDPFPRRSPLASSARSDDQCETSRWKCTKNDVMKLITRLDILYISVPISSTGGAIATGRWRPWVRRSARFHGDARSASFQWANTSLHPFFFLIKIFIFFYLQQRVLSLAYVTWRRSGRALVCRFHAGAGGAIEGGVRCREPAIVATLWVIGAGRTGSNASHQTPAVIALLFGTRNWTGRCGCRKKYQTNKKI